jgi:hypothetical protein
MQVRREMKCQPFSTYLDKHFPDMIRPNKEHTQARGFLQHQVRTGTRRERGSERTNERGREGERREGEKALRR